MKKSIFEFACIGMVSATALMAASAPAYAQQAEARRDFNIPAQPLASALNEFSRQSDAVVTAPARLTRQRSAPAVRGNYTPREALQALLAGSGLRYRIGSGGSFVVEANPERAAVQEPVSAPTTLGSSDDIDNTEIVVTGVTGSNIRGAIPASPTQAFSRDEIDRSGVGSVQEFILRLPANFKGGASEGTVGIQSGGGRTVDTVGGTGINLRGLGNDSTLVLLNGHRLAPGNTTGNYVDVSLIPLAALQRVEIVRDGASAVYGSDAVGGVVNFILRRDYNGANTRLRYGSVTEGGAQEFQFGQTFGRAWNSGSALISYEYYDRTALEARDRDYVTGVNGPFFLLPDQRRHSVLFTGHLDIAPTVTLFSDVGYMQRDRLETVFTTAPTLRDARVRSINGTVGLEAQLATDTRAELSTSYSNSDTRLESFFNGNLFVDRDVETSVWSIDGKVDGTIFSLPAGDVRFAVGGQYRREQLSSLNRLDSSLFSESRNLYAIFAELNVPVISTETAPNLLTISAANRFEHYSDFGSTNNPKFGIVLQPTRELRFRATYGTSFKAPLLNDLNPVPFQTVTIQQFDPTIGGQTPTLIVFGGNPNLRPETASSWTAGFDWDVGRRFRLSGTYYNISYRNRIADAQTSGFNIVDALRAEAILGPEIIRRNPSLATVQSLIALPGYFNACSPAAPCPASSITAIVDSRALNLASLNTSGLDLSFSTTQSWLGGQVDLGLEATYIFEFENKTTAQAPVNDVLNTQYNPVDLRMRGNVGFTKGGFSGSLFLNYVDSYRNTLGGITTRVPAWTTADLSLAYTFQSGQGPLSGLTISLGALNITDQDPPRVTVRPPLTGGNPALNFDGANANVLGRFLYIQLTKEW